MKRIGKLHILTDFSFQQKYSHAELARLAIQGGADTIQFRQKHGSIRDFLASARSVQEVCAESGTTFLVNDRVDIAMAVGANGVHLGQEDLPLEDARRVMGPEAIIGLTTPTLALAEKAARLGADYVGFGPVYPTKSKANPAAVKGVDGLSQFCKGCPLPVIAIAGITVDRCAEVLAAGAYGVAVMTAVSLAQYPEIEAQKFALAVRG
jgi:thiamine-phosphate pyrophosphorylase